MESISITSPIGQFAQERIDEAYHAKAYTEKNGNPLTLYNEEDTVYFSYDKNNNLKSMYQDKNDPHPDFNYVMRFDENGPGLEDDILREYYCQFYDIAFEILCDETGKIEQYNTYDITEDGKYRVLDEQYAVVYDENQ